MPERCSFAAWRRFDTGFEHRRRKGFIMNIVVLCGGLSVERDVSLSSAMQIAQALRNNGHRAVIIDSFFGYTGKYGDPADIFSMPYIDPEIGIGQKAPDIDAVKRSRVQDNDSRIGDNVIEICRAADIVFMALHGEDGEDGKLQAMFDIMDIRYTGCGYFGSALAMNKAVAKCLFRQNGILTPESLTLSRGASSYGSVGFPCVVKPCSGTSVVYDESEYDAALQLAFKYDSSVVIEQFIKGRECDVGVIAGKALPVIEICPKSGFYNYENKYQSGLTDEYCPADLDDDITAKIQKAAEDVFNTLGLDVYARMDFIVSENGDVYCLEANTLPGMTPLSLLPQEAAAVGISYSDLCELIISESMKKYA